MCIRHLPARSRISPSLKFRLVDVNISTSIHIYPGATSRILGSVQSMAYLPCLLAFATSAYLEWTTYCLEPSNSIGSYSTLLRVEFKLPAERLDTVLNYL